MICVCAGKRVDFKIVYHFSGVILLRYLIYGYNFRVDNFIGSKEDLILFSVMPRPWPRQGYTQNLHLHEKDLPLNLYWRWHIWNNKL